MEIVRLSLDNAGLLDHVADDVFDGPVNAAWLRAFLADPRHIMVVVVDGPAVVGMASAFEYFHPDKPPQLFINEVGVAPTHQRRGLGRRLTEALVSVAHERGCVSAWLATAVDNRAAQACFSTVPGSATAGTALVYEWDMERR